MKVMKFPSALRSSLVLLISSLVLCCITVDATLTQQRVQSRRALRLASHVSKKGEPAASNDEEHAAKDDDQQGDDDDDDDDDDTDEEAVTTPAPEVNPHAAEEAQLVQAVKEADEELSENLAEQKQLKHKLKQLTDESSSNYEIDLHAKKVANETDSAEMASMLAHMWKDMRMFEVPSYTRHAEEELRHLRHKEKKIEEKLTAAQAQLSNAKRGWAVEKSITARGGKEPAPDEKKAAPPKSPNADEDAQEGTSVVTKTNQVIKQPGKAANEAVDQSFQAAVLTRWSVWHMNSQQRRSVFISSLVYLLFGILLAYIYNQVRAKGTFQPSPRRAQSPTPYREQPKDFSFNLFGCFGDVNVCIVGCCCPHLRWADTMDRKELLKFFPAFGVMFGLMLLHVYTMGISSLIACFVGLHYRQKLRRRYNMNSGMSTIVCDMLAWICCQPCAIIQEAREEAIPRDGP